MKIKVSVIIPVYNVEKYLKQCLDSVLDQTLKEIEIILIDDGSTDSSGKITDDYASKDSRIVVVHQKNSGYSAAVNKGIKNARGKYIGIIESDDFVEPNMFEDLFNEALANNADIAKGMFYKYNSLQKPRDVVFKNPCGVDLSLAPDSVFTPSEWPQIIAFHSSIWSSIYRKNLIQNTQIPISAGASYQDLPFMINIMTKAKRIIVVKKPFVHWRNEPSQNHSTSDNGKKSLMMVKNSLLALRILKNSGLYNSLKEGFFAQIIWTNSYFFFRIDKKFRKDYYILLRDIFLVLKGDSSFKGKFLRLEDKFMIDVLIKDKGILLFRLAYLFGSLRRKVCGK